MFHTNCKESFDKRFRLQVTIASDPSQWSHKQESEITLSTVFGRSLFCPTIHVQSASIVYVTNNAPAAVGDPTPVAGLNLSGLEENRKKRSAIPRLETRVKATA